MWGGEGRDFYSSWREERTTWGLLVRNFCYCNQTDSWKIIPQYAHLKMSISQSNKILLRKAYDLKSKKKKTLGLVSTNLQKYFEA